MTRKEEIEKAANQKYPYEGGIKGMICENSIPIFIKGAEWADKTMIEKACEWVKENFECYVGADVSPYYIYVDEFVEDFRKVMLEEE